jgi:hypothetical protein
MLKLLVKLLCCLLYVGMANAQPKDSLSKMTGLFLKVNPLAILETDGGLGFSVEYILPKAPIGIQLEVQPIFFSLYGAIKRNGWEAPVYTTHSGRPKGIEIRPEIRWYLSGKRAADRSDENQFYLATDFLFKRTWRKRTSTIKLNPVSTQVASYTDIKNVLGFDIKAGYIIAVSDDAKRWIELFGGLGMRVKEFSYSHLPNGAVDPLRRDVLQVKIFNNDEEIGHSLKSYGFSFPIGFKYVYRF